MARRSAATDRARRGRAAGEAGADEPATREIPLEPGPIVRATDLGNVQTLKHSTVFLLTDQFGDIHPDTRGLGLYQDDTRILSRLELRLNGQRPALLQADAAANYRGTIQLTNADETRNPGPDAEPVVGELRQSFGIERDRVLDGGMRERIRIVNYSAGPATLELSVDLASDAADIFEVRGYERPGRGTLEPVRVDGGTLTFRYRGRDGSLRTTQFALSGSPAIGRSPSGDAVRVLWTWTIAPGASAEAEWIAWSRLGDAPSIPPVVSAEAGAAAYRAWTSGTTRVETDHEVLNRIIARSLADLRLLVNDGPQPGERHIAAGVPWFATLFGRDSIITSLQTLAFRPQLAVETLRVLAARQSAEVDDWRDAEPGKILHELRSTEMVRSREVPFGPYYGSVDATPLFLTLLSETYRWTGDRALVDHLWPNALAALAWLDRAAADDPDGFVAYRRRSSGGLFNQGWKDSGDAVRRRDGSQATPPIRLAEVQGYAFDARRRMAELARVRGEEALAADLERRAEDLRAAFEREFWVEDLGTYAMALDADGRQADAVTSNPGHCLWSGIVAPDRARAVADRLLGPQLFSGWGIRSFGSGQPGFNPIGYHTGTVWPHDSAIAAAGLRRYGFDDEASRVATALFEAAEHFPGFRLPEVFCGFDRASTGVPVAYPVACSPQAWAAGTPYLLLQSLLGLAARADRRELELRRPQLPAWLSRVTLTNVRVGDAAVDLLFHRWRGTTSAEVLRKVGDVAVTIRL